MSVNDVLCGMGSVQLESFGEKGYMPLIKALGQDLWEFLEHIDALHQNLGQYSRSAYLELEIPFVATAWCHHARSPFPYN